MKSAIGAVEDASVACGSISATAQLDNRVTTPATAVPDSVARGTLRTGSSMASAGTEALSRPSNANTVTPTAASVAEASKGIVSIGASAALPWVAINQAANPITRTNGSSLISVETIWMPPANARALPSANKAMKKSATACGPNGHASICGTSRCR